MAGLLVGSFGTAAGTFKTITIDGALADWTGVPLAHEDPADATTSADYRNIWIANDSDYLYLRFTLERPEDPFTANDNIFIDADNDPLTGFALFLGSEMLIQGGVGYQEKNGGFNEGAIEALDWQAAADATGTDFEMRISRRARFAADGLDVFQSSIIALLLEAEDANFTRQETAPDTEGLVYEFAEPPPPLNTAVALVPLTASWRYRSGGADPGPDWASPEYDDSQAGWASGTALFGFTTEPGSYPIPVATELDTSAITDYFRLPFTWENDSAGAVFVVTNYLSDGARFFLNGAEVRRVRLPAGELTPATPATGAPAVAGEAEIFGLDPGPLVQGENLLAVEVHQGSATPLDLVFGLSLLASPSFPAVFTNPAEPTDRGVTAGESTTFSAEVLGSGPLEYQWLKDGAALAGATNATLILDPVLPGDAGRYALRVSNSGTPAGVTSREAVLTVLGVPAAISRQPASVTATEGTAAEFSIEASGSAPLSYQWFRDGVAIPDATNSTYAIESAALTDAGMYRVSVSNPVTTPAIESDAAQLTVLEDTAPPGLVRVEGSPNTIVVNFTEPVDTATAQNPANYTVSNGLNVTSATLDPADPATVNLATSGQTLGNRYTLTISGIQDRFGNAILQGMTRSFVSAIRIDGSFADWEGIPQSVDDPADAENATDYAAAWIASDGDFIYLRVRLHQPSELGIFYNNLFIDTDATLETGFAFRGIGSEILIQGGGGYQQKNGGFNEGAVEDLDWLIRPEGVAEEFELRFSRRARFASDGQPVFAGESIVLFLESENTSFQTIDVAPDFEPLIHELSDAPPSAIGPLSISSAAGGVTIRWTGPGQLQSAPALSTDAWQPVPDAASPYEFSPTGAARFYRLAQ
jgi:hypothetical protein